MSHPAAPNHCLECDAPLATAVAGGLCPKCLLKLGLASQFGETSVGEAGLRRMVAPPQFPFDFGGYHVRRLLGRGGMGAVYEADQMATGRRVALKVLGQSLDSPEMRKRFLREGRLAASVNHPHSVYIFGTEEIEGAPVIAMELIAGGTLRDEIKHRGPFSPRKAVDTILQVIAGLECAAAAGVLHRDVKPENCFVTPEGTVKVGDFGLSVSTLARQDTQITESGSMVGTPSYAPPEQLRGDELDVRADIYSVGATLYALLTGQAPFRGDNVVNIVAAVLNTPPPANLLPRGLPAGLAHVVLRCLAKDRTQRFADYASLREALLPYSSAVAVPASPATRFAAGLIDVIFAMILPAVLALAFSDIKEEDLWLAQRSLPSFLVWLGFQVFAVGYFALSEGRWGASVGKALLRLRVTTATGAVPGVARAAIRGCLFVLAFQTIELLTAAVSTGEEYRAAQSVGRSLLPGWSIAIPFAILFATMRRRNGFASLLDLASGTRVVVRPSAGTRTPASLVPPASIPESGERIGPFRMVEAGDGFIAAADDALRRPVWIFRRPPGASPLPSERRELGRATRLRWLQGTRSETESWDAFEAPAGRPWHDVLSKGAPSWGEARHWMLDLAEEFDACAKDGTCPPTLSLSHLWITHSGRAVLLDDPWPGTGPAQPVSPEQFLTSVAQAVDRKTLPLHARQVLDNFAGGTLDRLSFLAGNLRSLLTRPLALDRRRRFLSLFTAPLLIAIFVFMAVLFIGQERGFHDRKWASWYPGRPPLSLILRMQVAASDPLAFFSARWTAREELDAAVARHIADRYSADFGGAAGLLAGNRMDLPLTEEERTLVAMLMARFPRPDPEKLTAAEATVLAALPAFRVAEDEWKWWFASYLFLLLIGLLAISQFFCILVLRGTLGQRMFGFAVVAASGALASRARLSWRWLIAWFPAALLGFGATELFITAQHSRWINGVIATAGIVWLAALLLAVLSPGRGWHDRLSGTWLVPR